MAVGDRMAEGDRIMDGKIRSTLARCHLTFPFRRCSKIGGYVGGSLFCALALLRMNLACWLAIELARVTFAAECLATNHIQLLMESLD